MEYAPIQHFFAGFDVARKHKFYKLALLWRQAFKDH